MSNTRRHLPRALMAAAVGLGVCLLLISPVLIFGVLTVGASLADLERRSDDERASSASLAADVVSHGMASRAEQLALFGQRDDVIDAFKRRDGGRLAELLAPVASGSPDLATAGALDAAGTTLARIPTDPAAIGQSFADRDYYAGALRTNGVYIGDAVTSRIDPRLVLVVLASAVREGGTVVGVGILTVRPSVIVGDLETALRAAGRELLLVDDRAATIASTAQRPTLGQLGLPATGRGSATVEGEPRVFAAAPIKGAAWTLFVLDDPAQIYSARRALAERLAAPIGAAIVMAAIFAILLAGAYFLLVRQRERLASANAQLQSANEQIEAATRAKSAFLASMSHELRTPLNSVLGFSDVLLEQLRGTASERQLRYLTNIRAAGSHLLELINDVLDLSKVEAGRLELRPEPVTITALLEPVLVTAAQLAADRGVGFEASAIPDGSAVVDPGRTRQVLLNLLSNAVKFTAPEGRVSLGVTAESGALRFDVTDTGIGIPDDKRDRVFGLFERLHEGRSDASGTGLGLAITKRLVELYGGTIDFTSREGEGSRFWVRLPSVMIEQTVGPRLLVVEDDARDGELYAALARDAGLGVEVVPTAAAALAAIARSTPTAVILDLRLPDRRGEAVLDALKTDARTARVPVLVVTVEDDDGRARLLGADDHLTKPVDHAVLARWLANINTGGPLARSAR